MSIGFVGFRAWGHFRGRGTQHKMTRQGFAGLSKYVFSRSCDKRLKIVQLHLWKTEGPRPYARYMGSSARAEWPTFLPS